MKRLHFLLAALLLTTACTSDKENYQAAVPEDAILAVKININSLLDKSEVLNDPQVRGALREGLNSLPRETRDVLKAMLDEPESCGLDLHQPMIVAIDNLERMTGVITLAVKDEQAVDAFLRALSDDEDLGREILTGTVKGTKVIESRGGDTYGAYDANKMVFAFARNHADAMDYIKLEGDKSAVNDKKFDSFFSARQDVALYADGEELYRLGELTSGYAFNINEKQIQGLSFLATLNFDAGAVEMKTSFNYNNGVPQQIKAMNYNTTNENLDFMPQGVYGALNVGLRDLGKGLSMLDNEYKNNVNEALGELHLTIDDLAEVNGDLTVAVLPMQEMRGNTMPQVVAMLEVSSSKLLDRVMEYADNESIEPVADHVYALGLNREIDWDYYERYGEPRYIRNGYDYYVGYVGGRIIVMPENIYNICVPNGRLNSPDKNLGNHRLSKVLHGNAMMIDMQYTLNDLRELIESDRSSRQVMPILQVIDSYNFSYLFDDDDQSITMRLEMTDQSQNALKTICDAIMQMAAR